MNDYLSFAMITISCVFAIQMFYYGIGKPLAENILSGSFLVSYSVFFSEKSLPTKVYFPIREQYNTMMENAANSLERSRVRSQYIKMIITTARDGFSWQKVIGFCTICTHFWFSLIVLSIAEYFFAFNFITFIFYFLTGHILNRLFNKWI